MAFLVLGAGLAHATTYVYDGNGRLRAVTNSTGASAEYVYDTMGNLLQVESVPAGQLAIFAFTPSHGAVGTTVTISGQGFSATATDDTVKFNGTAATVTKATTTTLTTSVPAGASTGAITVTVGTNTATSADIFTVDNTGLPPTITSFSPTIGAIGTAVTVVGKNLEPVNNQTTVGIGGGKTIPTSATQAQVVFPVTSNMGSGTVSVTTPFGMAASTGYFYVTPPGISAANVSVTTTIAVGGSKSLNIPSGKYAAVAFNATGGSWLSFQASSIVGSIGYTIYDGHNSPITSGTLSIDDASIHLPAIPMTGTYSIWLSSGSTAATFTLGLQADSKLAINGASVAAETTAPGQSVRLIFTSTANENVGLGISGVTTSGGYNWVEAEVYNAFGGLVASASQCGYDSGDTSGCGLDSQSLPTGTNQIVVSPPNDDNTMSFTSTLSHDVAGKLSLNSPTSVVLSRIGQTGTYTFSATAGQTLAVEMSNVTTTPASGEVAYTVYAPNGAVISSFLSSTALNIYDLPQGGTYQLYVQPGAGVEALTLTETLELVPGVTGTLEVNGPSQTFATQWAGQYAYLTFTTTATENVGLAITNISASVDSYLSAEIYDASGEQVTAASCTQGTGNDSGCAMYKRNLPAGTYEVEVLPPDGGGTMSFTATLSQDATGTLSLDTPTNVTLPRSGEAGTYTFNATAGQTLMLGVSNVATTPTGGNVSYMVYGPNGSEVDGGSNTGAYAFNLHNVQQSGTYQMYVQAYTDTLTESIELEPGVTGAVTVNGSPETFTTTQPGAFVYVTFAATAGENVELGLSNLSQSPDSTSSMLFDVYDSENNLVNAVSCTPGNGSCELDLQGLAGGSYQIIAEPYPYGTNADIMSFTVALTQQ